MDRYAHSHRPATPLRRVHEGYELATGPVASKDLLTTRWFLVLGVEFELALGLALLSGVLPKVTWFVALLCFSGFTVITGGGGNKQRSAKF